MRPAFLLLLACSLLVLPALVLLGWPLLLPGRLLLLWADSLLLTLLVLLLAPTR